MGYVYVTVVAYMMNTIIARDDYIVEKLSHIELISSATRNTTSSVGDMNTKNSESTMRFC
jgi:hypothetical protein